MGGKGEGGEWGCGGSGGRGGLELRECEGWDARAGVVAGGGGFVGGLCWVAVSVRNGLGCWVV